MAPGRFLVSYRARLERGGAVSDLAYKIPDRAGALA